MLLVRGSTVSNGEGAGGAGNKEKNQKNWLELQALMYAFRTDEAESKRRGCVCVGVGLGGDKPSTRKE